MLWMSLIMNANGKESLVIAASNQQEAELYASSRGEVIDITQFSHQSRRLAGGIIAANSQHDCPYYGMTD